MNNKLRLNIFVGQMDNVHPIPPCELDDLLDIALADIADLVKNNPNNYELGRKVRSYITERSFRESSKDADDSETVA